MDEIRGTVTGVRLTGVSQRQVEISIDADDNSGLALLWLPVDRAGDYSLGRVVTLTVA